MAASCFQYFSFARKHLFQFDLKFLAYITTGGKHVPFAEEQPALVRSLIVSAATAAQISIQVLWTAEDAGKFFKSALGPWSKIKKLRSKSRWNGPLSIPGSWGAGLFEFMQKKQCEKQ